MLFAVPSIVRIADSKFVVFKSGILIFAISSSFAREIDPTFVRFGSLEPFGIPDAFLNQICRRSSFRFK